MTLRNRRLVDELIERALGTDAQAAPAEPEASDQEAPEQAPEAAATAAAESSE
jgi:hypothetical protein